MKLNLSGAGQESESNTLMAFESKGAACVETTWNSAPVRASSRFYFTVLHPMQ